MSQPKPSGRKGSKKVRTGCTTCKARKVKCDEAKPACLRCTKTGRRCDGYQDLQSFFPGTLQRDARGVAAVAAQDELQALLFFQEVTAPGLADGRDPWFWQEYVPHMTQNKPSVRHAVLAVGLLHQAAIHRVPRRWRNEKQPPNSAATYHYNRAITHLLNQPNDPLVQPLTSLVVCILFVCIESMLLHNQESVLHFEQGRQILHRLDTEPRAYDVEVEYINEHIRPFYSSLELASNLFGTHTLSTLDTLFSRPSIPEFMASQADLQQSFGHVIAECASFAQTVKVMRTEQNAQSRFDTLHRQQAQLVERLQRLDSALRMLLTTVISPRQQVMLNLLHIRLLAQKLWIMMALSNSEVAYDEQMSTFAHIIELTIAAFSDEGRQQLLHQSKQHTSWPQSAKLDQRPSVPGAVRASTATSLASTLCFVAIKCRQPSLRAKALELLRSSFGIQDSIWRAGLYAAMATRLANVEQSHSLDANGASAALHNSVFGNNYTTSEPVNATQGLNISINFADPTELLSSPRRVTYDSSQLPYDKSNLHASSQPMAGVPTLSFDHDSNMTRNRAVSEPFASQNIDGSPLTASRLQGAWTTSSSSPSLLHTMQHSDEWLSDGATDASWSSINADSSIVSQASRDAMLLAGITTQTTPSLLPQLTQSQMNGFDLIALAADDSAQSSPWSLGEHPVVSDYSVSNMLSTSSAQEIEGIGTPAMAMPSRTHYIPPYGLPEELRIHDDEAVMYLGDEADASLYRKMFP